MSNGNRLFESKYARYLKGERDKIDRMESFFKDLTHQFIETEEGYVVQISILDIMDRYEFTQQKIESTIKYLELIRVFDRVKLLGNGNLYIFIFKIGSEEFRNDEKRILEMSKRLIQN